MGAIFDLANKKRRAAELEQVTREPDFWSDNERALKIQKERSLVCDQIETFEKLESAFEDLEVSFELIKESKDEELLNESDEMLLKAESGLEALELQKMLSGKHDSLNAIIEINSGAGGTEAQDWVEMLLRMYLRWADKRGFKAELISANPGDEAGLKSVTVRVEGQSAFGYLRSERGVHRLVRISPFDSNARRHTSFASVFVMPEIDDSIEIDISPDELRVDTYRASGAGGQHINKTDSAVRITHIKAGVVVACQNERSQHKNKATCMKLLKAKLYEIELQKKQEEAEKIGGEKQKIDFGSQIRSYVMQPYQMVKDLRTGFETGNVSAVLDGELDGFIKAFLMG